MLPITINSRSIQFLTINTEVIKQRVNLLASKLKESTPDSCLKVLFPGLDHHKKADGVQFHIYNTLVEAARPNSFSEQYLSKRLANIAHFGFANACAILTTCIHLAHLSGNMEKSIFFENQFRSLMAAHPNESRNIPLQLSFDTELVNSDYQKILQKAHLTYVKLNQGVSYNLSRVGFIGGVLFTIGIAWLASKKFVGNVSSQTQPIDKTGSIQEKSDTSKKNPETSSNLTPPENLFPQDPQSPPKNLSDHSDSQQNRGQSSEGLTSSTETSSSPTPIPNSQYSSPSAPIRSELAQKMYEYVQEHQDKHEDLVFDYSKGPFFAPSMQKYACAAKELLVNGDIQGFRSRSRATIGSLLPHNVNTVSNTVGVSVPLKDMEYYYCLKHKINNCFNWEAMNCG